MSENGTSDITDTAQSQHPLAVTTRNTGIPRPMASRLPMPSGTRKRPASEMTNTSVHSEGKENGPSQAAPSKKPRLDDSTSQPKQPKPVTVAKTRPTTARPAGKSNTTKPTTLSSRTSTAATRRTTSATGSAKPSTSTAARATAKPGVSKVTGGKPGPAGKNGNGAGVTKEKSKRPAWDLKGRLQDMEARMASEKQTSMSTIAEFQAQMSEFFARISGLEQVKMQQEGTIQSQIEEKSAASSTIKSLESALAEAKTSLLESTRRYEHELELLRLSKSALQRSHDQIEAELTTTRDELTSLKSMVSRMAADASAIQCQLDATKVARDQAMADGRNKAEEIALLKQQILEQQQTIADCQARIRDDETTRRGLHNTILELKGNIRVFCRVRPLLPSDGDGESRSSTGSSTSGRPSSPQAPRISIGYPDSKTEERKIALKVSSGDQQSCSSGNKSYDFEFDHVFSPESTQEAVFSEISQLVQSALDGYNVCIFAYGQTGSGKTFTMEGPGDDDERRGMIPRAVEQVFVSCSKLIEKGWQYTMEASFVEIYNETLRDLLATATGANGGEKLEIRLAGGGNSSEVHVTNLTVMEVTSEAQVSRLLERAAKNRAVAATLCNERSSRSHSVFRLKLSGRNTVTGEACQGTLNLIDLAGSERLSNSGSVGERLKETKNINKSLSNLGNVIMALANKEQHIPYRNSKLTYLLQNSLGGNSKTLMFVNVAPHAPALQETLCSLRFATKVNQCNIGTATKKVLK